MASIRQEDAVIETRGQSKTGGLNPYMRFDSVKNRVRRAVEESTRRRILLVGPGPNQLELALDNSAHAIAIDISPKNIKRLRKTGRGHNLSIMNAEEAGLKDHSFDVIYMHSVLHHLNTDKALSEISRLLKENGRLIIAEPLGINPVINLTRKLTPSLRTKDEEPLKIKQLNKIRDSFKETEITFHYLLAPAALLFAKTPKLVFNKLWDTLEQIDAQIFKHIPPLRYLAWTVVIVADEPVNSI